MTTGQILNIQRFCTDDGPGIRTTVFLKGCPLRCVWCHNPESQAKQCEIAYDTKKCIGCGRCAVACSWNCHAFDETHKFVRKTCIGCGDCAKTCPTKALEVYGKTVTVEDVYREIEKDTVFYQTSGGGVTVSGGEPLFQADFTAELLKKCRENKIHTAIETSGFADEKTFLKVLAYCDFVLFDVKETDEERHKQYTGVSSLPIHRNLKLMNEQNVPFIIRAPMIPTFNDRKAHFKALKVIRESMQSCQGIQIMPYHKIGVYKYGLLDRNYVCDGISAPSKETVERWNELL